VIQYLFEKALRSWLNWFCVEPLADYSLITPQGDNSIFQCAVNGASSAIFWTASDGSGSQRGDYPEPECRCLHEACDLICPDLSNVLVVRLFG
jgi:hypothetical protein